MLKWLLRRRMKAFEKEYDYDLSYAREILEISTRAAFKLGRVMGFGNYREDVPRDASFAAGLAGTMAEDCGPCTQLAVTMAEREGVALATIRAILAGDECAMTPEAALGFALHRQSCAMIRRPIPYAKKSWRDGAGVRWFRWHSGSPRRASTPR
jgi:hypothetical protein